MAHSTVGNLLEWASSELTSFDTPNLDARVLLQHVAKRSHSQLISHADNVLSNDKTATYRELIARRRQGTPVAYLTGEREFWSLVFKVTPATLIPRPDTELLVEKALVHIPKQQTLTVADIGTGCGAVALALAHERLETTFIATDISQEVLAVAKLNGKRLGIHNVKYHCGNLVSPLKKNCCDIIVSNPPYICDNDPHLNEGDVAFEPRSALVSGSDGLDTIRLIASKTPQKLKARGWLLVEHGYDQARQVRAILKQETFVNIETHYDLSGHARITQGQLA